MFFWRQRRSRHAFHASLFASVFVCWCCQQCMHTPAESVDRNGDMLCQQCFAQQDLYCMAINQSIRQSVNQSISQSINQSINQSIQSINQSTDRSIDHCMALLLLRLNLVMPGGHVTAACQNSVLFQHLSAFDASTHSATAGVMNKPTTKT